MSEDSKRFIDPKDAFLFKLTENLDKIYYQLSEEDPKIQIKGVEAMCWFIARLKINPEWKDMKTLQEKWTPDIGYYTSMFHNNGSYRYGEKVEMYDSEVASIWRKLSDFMNATYFKGWSSGTAQEKRRSGKL